MTCETVKLPGGVTAIVCHRGPRTAKRCACGRPAHYECDAVLKTGHVNAPRKTCDRPLCERCTTQPKVGVDLCPEHAIDGPPEAA